MTTYAYEFNDENAPSPEFPRLSFPLEAFHSSDVQYLFNRLGTPAPFTPDQQRLSQAMIRYWTSSQGQAIPTRQRNLCGRPMTRRLTSVCRSCRRDRRPSPGSRPITGAGSGTASERDFGATLPGSRAAVQGERFFDAPSASRG